MRSEGEAARLAHQSRSTAVLVSGVRGKTKVQLTHQIELPENLG